MMVSSKNDTRTSARLDPMHTYDGNPGIQNDLPRRIFHRDAVGAQVCPELRRHLAREEKNPLHGSEMDRCGIFGSKYSLNQPFINLSLCSHIIKEKKKQLHRLILTNINI